ncbi:DUF6171 family protein [Aquibacillus kalidii]|uniref:DUF6171 family protein n=1 Tax=Aquibacillus kalidii TaxID=2762597 RepID=UPI001648825E|nr:DUF6171 family protein [Aquibacillus kalidii]
MSCKGCSASVIVTDAEVEQLVKEQLALEVDLVDDRVYIERLSRCQECPSLAYTNTCGHCGCLVQFRAKLAYKTCPDPSGNRWLTITK